MASGVPGVPEPIGEDYLVRRVKALERRLDELGPSLMLATAEAIGAIVVPVELKATSAHLDELVTSATLWTFTATCPVPAGAVSALLNVTFTSVVQNTSGPGNLATWLMNANTKLDGSVIEASPAFGSNMTDAASTSYNYAHQVKTFSIPPGSTSVTATFVTDFVTTSPGGGIYLSCLDRIDGAVLFLR